MRKIILLLVLMVVLPGCLAGALVAIAMTAEEMEAQRINAQRAELMTIRINSGLTREEFMEEMRRLDPEWVRRVGKRAIYDEARKRGVYAPHQASMLQEHQLPGDLRARLKDLPTGKTFWSVDHLLYRARRLGAGASEAKVQKEMLELEIV